MTHAFQHDTNEGGGVVGRSYPQAVGCGWLRAWGGRGWRRRLLRPPGAYSGTNVGTNVGSHNKPTYTLPKVPTLVRLTALPLALGAGATADAGERMSGYCTT